ncbi:MAG: hypothetical protein JSS43_12655 [Proteobacteria bacterium]|nr:hypothetical protein [Pseudomonadota bacterium]
MKRNLCRWTVIVPALLLSVAPAVAQKIAPSRQYNDPVDTPARTYTAPSQPTLDKNYGLPTFGTPDAVTPKQRTLATPRPQQPGEDPALPFLAPPPETAALSAPIGRGAVDPMTMGQDALPDVFARDRADEPLPSETQRAGQGGATGMSLFTTGPATTSNGSGLGRGAGSRTDPLFTTGAATTSLGSAAAASSGASSGARRGATDPLAASRTPVPTADGLMTTR